MNYSKEDIVKYVRSVCGYHYIEGLFISDDVVNGDLAPEDAYIITNFAIQSTANIDIYDDDDIEDDYQVFMGMTKLVIVPKHKDYVIKIPFTGFYKEDEIIEDDWDYEPTFVLSRKRFGKSSCKKEIQIYSCSTQSLKKLLLPLEYFGNIDNISIYIQKKYQVDYSNTDYHWKDEAIDSIMPPIKKKLVEKVSKDTNSTLEWSFISLIIRQYGIKETYEMLNEINDWGISDLHAGNYGFDKNGNVIIFDYAGYEDNYYYT